MIFYSRADHGYTTNGTHPTDKHTTTNAVFVYKIPVYSGNTVTLHMGVGGSAGAAPLVSGRRQTERPGTLRSDGRAARHAAFGRQSGPLLRHLAGRLTAAPHLPDGATRSQTQARRAKLFVLLTITIINVLVFFTLRPGRGGVNSNRPTLLCKAPKQLMSTRLKPFRI